MTIHFTKMHGLGNDFIVIDAIHQTIDLPTALIAALSQRHTGIGFDQCLLIERPRTSDVDFFYRIFNANGQEVGQCGNGARCLARFAYYYGLTNKRTIRIATKASTMQLQLHDDKTVTIDMGRPKLSPIDIPLLAPIQADTYAIPLRNHDIAHVHALSVGNPHAIMTVNTLTNSIIKRFGKQISEHVLFPEQTNVGFMQIASRGHIYLRVYERGCGETRACGSGAVAAVAAGRLYHQLAETVTVSLPGGELIVTWPSLEGSIFLKGPAEFVYEGHLSCEL